MKKNILKLSIFALILGIIITSLGLYMSKGRVGIKKTSSGWKYIYDKGEIISKTDYLNQPKSIKIDADFYNIEFIKSDEFKLEYTYNGDNEPFIESKDGVVSFVSAYKKRPLKNQITIGLNLMDNRFTNSLKIYYDNTSEFENFEITSNGGKINLSNVNVKNLIIHSDLQELTLENITGEEINIFSDLSKIYINNISTDTISIDSNLSKISIEDGNIKKALNISSQGGNIRLKNVTAKNTKIKSEISEYTLSESVLNNLELEIELGKFLTSDTTLLGEIKINSAFTDLNLNLTGSKNDYDYNVSSEFATVKINNENIKSGFSTNNNKQSFMDITLESGSVVMDFTKD